MKKISEILEPIKIPDNFYTAKEWKKDEEPLIFIPKDKSYIELAGHRIEGVGDFSELKKFLEYIKEVEIENKQLKRQMSEMGEYILTKYEEAKLNSQYIDGTRIPNVQERVYEDLVNRMELN